MNYKILEKEFIKHKFKHLQLKREGDVAIYIRKKEDARNWHYEVIKITRHDGHELFGNKIQPAEIYPSASTWGTFGWTYNTIELAEIKFKELLNKK
jgi:hypothetical protein